MNKKINDAGLSIIKSFESCELKSYQDTGGVWTIGYGHTKNVGPGMRISQSEADQFLKEDVSEAERIVDKHIKAALTDNEFSALVSFAFNLGPAGFRKKDGSGTKIATYLNSFNKAAAAKSFLSWIYDNGKPLKGLMRRRQAEMELFLKE